MLNSCRRREPNAGPFRLSTRSLSEGPSRHRRVLQRRIEGQPWDAEVRLVVRGAPEDVPNAEDDVKRFRKLLK
jgi:hypothetical protein